MREKTASKLKRKSQILRRRGIARKGCPKKKWEENHNKAGVQWH